METEGGKQERSWDPSDGMVRCQSRGGRDVEAEGRRRLICFGRRQRTVHDCGSDGSKSVALLKRLRRTGRTRGSERGPFRGAVGVCCWNEERALSGGQGDGKTRTVSLGWQRSGWLVCCFAGEQSTWAGSTTGNSRRSRGGGVEEAGGRTAVSRWRRERGGRGGWGNPCALFKCPLRCSMRAHACSRQGVGERLAADVDGAEGGEPMGRGGAAGSPDRDGEGVCGEGEELLNPRNRTAAGTRGQDGSKRGR